MKNHLASVIKSLSFKLTCHVPDLRFGNQDVETIRDNQIRNYSIYLKEINKEINDESHLTSFRMMLLEYMLECSHLDMSSYCVKVLFKLCSSMRAVLLSDRRLLARIPPPIAIENLDILYEHQQYNSIALIRFLNNEIDEALEIWKQ
jgi:hypothetical protein